MAKAFILVLKIRDDPKKIFGREKHAPECLKLLTMVLALLLKREIMSCTADH